MSRTIKSPLRTCAWCGHKRRAHHVVKERSGWKCRDGCAAKVHTRARGSGKWINP